jgi:hypothetical protein
MRTGASGCWGVFVLSFCVVTADVADAQPNRIRRGFRIGLALIQDEDIQSELTIKPQQTTLLEALQTDLMTQAAGRRRGGQGQESRVEVTDKLLATILDQSQARRLRQLEVQFEGVRAFQRDHVVVALGLSQEQKDRIQEYSLGEQSTPEDVHRLAVEVLSDDQLGKWNRELYGDEFEFSDEVQRLRRFITGIRNRVAGGRGAGEDDQTDD